MAKEYKGLVTTTGEPLRRVVPTRPTQAGDEPVVEPPKMEVINGVRVARRLIFKAAADTMWQGEALLAIATAKALGFTLFEIDIEGRPPQGKKQAPSGMAAMFMDIEAWASSARASECSVSVWTVVVE